MLAHLLTVIFTGSGAIHIQIPFKDMDECIRYMSDPAPLVISGNFKPMGTACIDKPVVPQGKPF